MSGLASHRRGTVSCVPGARRSNRALLASERGFSLIEMLVASAITLVVTGATFALLNPARGAFQAQPEVSELQQRLRVGVDTLYKDMVMAGAGTYSGALVGNLSSFFAPVQPARLGRSGADAPGTARSDAISIFYVPPTPAQTNIANSMPTPSSEIKVTAQPGCPAGDALCGFKVGMRVIIFDDAGSYDVFTVTEVQEPAQHLQHNLDNFSKSYGAGSYVAQVSSHTYYFDSTAAQLRHYDGSESDLPVVDNVVGLTIDYFGEPMAPELRKPVTDPKGPWTTYGPKPPPLGVDNAVDSWGAGENCVFKVDPVSGLQVGRMPNLGIPGDALVNMNAAMMTDGPWCPDATATNRYDADLLRIRKIRVRLRLQVASSTLRGPAGPLFSRGGTSRGGQQYVPDQEIRFDVTPRNLNLGR